MPRIMSLCTRTIGRALQTRQHKHYPTTVGITMRNIPSRVVNIKPVSLPDLVPRRGDGQEDGT
ncbi:uncharacterized protein BDZ83DRAFT_644404 [Colletotrichum acutatum]|uniref:Uncharacterized protein n=1 Tax=Glomerella acutata TaxID=27357 RepID=A0AAD8U954_GLOAC|nr:uncharacterized protein BDZ83DRAFT_644404 [Colletotrichum acutatum]KAK1705023.1 hypothetical protein BDZ83DRAFT_644404 [Colletotrichum acutatum]